MVVKEKYCHSVALSTEMEQKLDSVRALGYSIPQILEVGMDELIKSMEKATPAKVEEF